MLCPFHGLQNVHIALQVFVGIWSFMKIAFFCFG